MKWPLVIKIALVFFAVAGLVQTGALVYLWISGTTFVLGHWIWLALLVTVSLLVLGLTFAFRARIWPDNPTAAEIRKLAQDTNRQFAQARSRARVIDTNNDNVPWYLFIASSKAKTSTVMAELGYVDFGDPLNHKGISISTWTSPTAQAYRIEVKDAANPSFELIDLLLKKLLQNRPFLAINAAYVEIELAELIAATSAHSGEISTINRILNVAAFEFGLNIPIHVALVGLDKMLDLSRAALLTGQLSEGVILGGFLTAGSIPAVDRAEALFDELISNLNQRQLAALQRQLLPEFCAALLNAPLQLELVKTQLRPRLSTLLQPLPPRSAPLDLQSIVFIGARDGMPEVDLLSQITGQKFFSNAPAHSRMDMVQTSVTNENAGLLARAYHAESFLLAPNRQKSAVRRTYAGLWTALLLGLVITFGYFSWENYRAYRAVNTRMETAFTQYFASISSLTRDSDFLVQRVLMLQPLREGLTGYATLNNQRYRSVLPRVSLEPMYRDLYNQELVDGFQASLISFIEKEIFAFNSLSDGVALIQLATIEAQLHTDQIRYKDDLIAYYSNGLADQGEVLDSFQASFRTTLDDLFTLNQPRAVRNESLRAVVSKTLTSLDTADLLYKALMRRPEYAERVDLRGKAGPRFFEVFVPLEDPDVFLVPRAFTRDGFDQLFEKGEMPDLLAALDGYEAAIGPIDAAQKNAISRRVAQSYTGAYIQRWSTFITSLRLREAEDWRDAQVLMTALTQPAENPVEQLVGAISAHTDIKVFLPVTATAADTEAAAPPQPKLAPPNSNVETAAAFNIQAAFRPYLDAMKPGTDGQSTFDLFLTYSRDVSTWLREATQAENGTGAYLFEQFQNPDAPNPLATLSAHTQRTELDILRSFGRNIVVTLDNRAMAFVRDHIDAQWQAQILTPYGAQLSQSFPFAPASDVDFPLAEFADLFGAEGKIRNFKASILAGFISQDGTFIPRATFLRTGKVELTDEAKSTLTRFNQISDSMFVDGKPFLEFGLRTGFLSSELGRLTVSSGVTLHQYSHGPIRWTPQTWPLAGAKNMDLSLRIFRRSRAVFNETYRGPWSWFRLAQDGSGSVNPAQGIAEVVFSTEGGQAILEMDATVRHTPFAPGFFTDVSLPSSLFDIYSAVEVPQDTAEPSESMALLFAWRNEVPAATQILIENNGAVLSPLTRRSIQQYLQNEGYYLDAIDGIFGPATRAALWAWRRNTIARDR